MTGPKFKSRRWPTALAQTVATAARTLTFKKSAMSHEQSYSYRVGFISTGTWGVERPRKKSLDLCYEGGGGFRDDSR